MSRFFVGCRVRILYSINWPELAGQEGRIIEASYYDERTMFPEDVGKPCWRVKPDSWPCITSLARTTGRLSWLGCKDDQIEPILPEGMQPASWEEGVWNPSMLQEEESCSV